MLEIYLGDITEETTDVIVNAANSLLAGGSGVDGAIHEAGGDEIVKECQKIIATQGECPTGEAVITSSGNLKCKYIIHTVGPIWSDGNDSEEDYLRRCYRNSLKLASNNGAITISFPAISTGAYGYPADKAALAALDETISFLKKKQNNFKKVRFIAHTEDSFDELLNALRLLSKKHHLTMQ